VPGIYVHSLLGSRNWNEGVAQTGALRTINREKLWCDAVEGALDDPESLRSYVFYAYRDLIGYRTGERAFHSNGAQRVLTLHPAAFALLRTSPDGAEHIVALTNVSDEPITVDLADVPLEGVRAYRDVLTGQEIAPTAPLTLEPYQVAWLKPVG